MRDAGPGAAFEPMSAEALLSLGSMEGVYELPVIETRSRPEPPAVKRASLWPAYLLTALVAAIAYLIHYLPFPPFQIVSGAGIRRPISAAIIAILAGTLVRNLFPISAAVVEGGKKIVRKAIPITIVLTGAGLNLSHLASLGFRALTITVLCIAVAAAAAYYFGRAFGLWRRTAVLIGAGTAICGTSAIIAVAPLIDAEDDDVMLSVGTVNLWGLILMFVCPLMGGLLQLGDDAFGVWAGTSIHAVPQVVAAGFAFSQKAGTLATLVKLVRVTLLAPFMFVLALLYARQQTLVGKRKKVTVHYARLVPPFVWGFLAIALVNTLGLIPSLQFHLALRFWSAVRDVTIPLNYVLVEAGNIFLAFAMAAMGLEVNIRVLARVGGKAVGTGVASSIVLCAVSLALIKLLL